MTKWEYVTVPLLTHATKQILDNWGDEGYELVAVVPGPNAEQLVAYMKRPKAVSGSTATERLAALGLTLPPVAAPVAAYVPAVRTGNYVYTSGQLPLASTGSCRAPARWATEWRRRRRRRSPAPPR